MMRKAAVMLSTVLALAVPASQAMAAAICGTVNDAQGNPASNVGVTVKSPVRRDRRPGHDGRQRQLPYRRPQLRGR